MPEKWTCRLLGEDGDTFVLFCDECLTLKQRVSNKIGTMHISGKAKMIEVTDKRRNLIASLLASRRHGHSHQIASLEQAVRYSS